LWSKRRRGWALVGPGADRVFVIILDQQEGRDDPREDKAAGDQHTPVGRALCRPNTRSPARVQRRLIARSRKTSRGRLHPLCGDGLRPGAQTSGYYSARDKEGDQSTRQEQLPGSIWHICRQPARSAAAMIRTMGDLRETLMTKPRVRSRPLRTPRFRRRHKKVVNRFGSLHFCRIRSLLDLGRHQDRREAWKSGFIYLS